MPIEAAIYALITVFHILRLGHFLDFQNQNRPARGHEMSVFSLLALLHAWFHPFNTPLESASICQKSRIIWVFGSGTFSVMLKRQK